MECLLSAFLILYLVSLSWEELSYVLPLTAANYVLVTILACLVLHEHVSALRWSGSVLVMIGIGLVARTKCLRNASNYIRLGLL